jgi:uncharacterized membrane protein
MRENGAPRVILLLLAAVAAVQLIHYYPQMPGRMIVHFGASGEPNGWSERLRFFLTFGALEAMVVAVGLLLPKLMASVPASFFNIPNRHYWFAPERREGTVAFLRTHILWIESATLLFLVGIAQITFTVNLSGGEKRLPGDFWIVVIAFVAVVIGLAIRIVLRFREELQSGRT